ncbi:MAG: TetR/AcrR family transcriptional regulator [Roseiarcus sp.]
MNDREKEICDAAARVFIRYGVKRTSMNDIAHEAGVARQTLYNLFANKDAVLVATIRLFMDGAIEATERGVADGRDFGEQLGIVFEHLAREPYRMLHASPNTEDIIEGVGEESRQAISESYRRFRDIIETLLAPFEEKIWASGTTARHLADAIRLFACAAKDEARDEAHLDELIETLTIMALRSVR